MRKKVDTLNLKPTPEGYAQSLLLILENSTSALDKRWARDQIIKAFKAAAQLNPKEWG